MEVGLMTWYWDHNDDAITVWDHNGDIVDQDKAFPGRWKGDYPNEVLDVIRENMDGDQPSAYNQSALAAAATGDIERGPPDQS